jgi:hypothetical protein
MSSEKKKVGRPQKKVSDLPEDWKETILDLSREGASIVELAVELDIARETFYALSERDEEFLDTVKKCKQLCEAWWVRNGRTNLGNKEFSYTGWYMNMKNRFNWADKQETKLSGAIESTVTTFALPENSRDE